MTSAMTPRALAAAVALASTAASLGACASQRAAAPAEGPTARWARRGVAVPGHGRVLLSIPLGWAVTEQAGGGEAGVGSVVLDGPGGAFRAILTPLWNPGEPESPQARVDTAQLFAEIARRKALAGSVERELPLERLDYPGVRGFYFTATDRELAGREPGPEEWRHILQGAAAVGPVILAFTLLDDRPGPQRSDLLAVVGTARHVADGESGAGADAAGELEAVPDAVTVPLRVAWPGKSWAVLVDLPGFRVGVRRGEPAMGPAVLAVDPEGGVVATVTFREGGGARDAAACRERAIAARAALPRTGALTRVEGTPARVAYVVTAKNGVPEAHLHAFLARDGLCAEVHVSKADPSPEDRARLEAILGSVRFGEDL